MVPAFSAFWRMLAAICSMLEETSSTLAACSVAPWARPWAEADSSSLPAARLSVAPCTSLHHAPELVDHLVEGLGQDADLVLLVNGQFLGKVTLGHVPGEVHAPAYGLDDAPGDDHGQQDAQEQRSRADDGHGLAGGGRRLQHLLVGS